MKETVYNLFSHKKDKIQLFASTWMNMETQLSVTNLAESQAPQGRRCGILTGGPIVGEREQDGGYQRLRKQGHGKGQLVRAG